MPRSIAVFHRKPSPVPSVPVPDVRPLGDRAVGEPSLHLDLEHRTWLARFPESASEVVDYPWDAYEAELCLPAGWSTDPSATVLATAGFGGPFASGALGRVPGEGPVPGDRVVAYRERTDDIVGIWLVTSARAGVGGEIRFGLRPLVSVTAPVVLGPDCRLDADLAACHSEWRAGASDSGRVIGGAASTDRPDLLALDGAGLAAVIRTVGVDPLLLCGPVDGLPPCSLTNRRPVGGAFRPAASLAVADSADALADRRALAEAVDWLLGTGSPSGVSSFLGPATEVETVNLGGGRGWCLIARGEADGAAGVQEVVAVGCPGLELDDLVLCPSVIHEAEAAADAGRNWALVATFGSGRSSRTIWLDALAVAACFDRFSGRLIEV